MSALPPRVEGFLGVTARELITGLSDARAQTRLVDALDACAGALGVIDAIDLDRFELFDEDLPDLSVWNEAAPQVGAALRGLHDATARLEGHFPPLPPRLSVSVSDDDLCFDVLESVDVPLEPPTRVGAEIDKWVDAEETPEQVLPALIGMLREDISAFGRKLRSPNVVSSRVLLLGEIQEFRARAVQCLEAMAAALLKPLGPHHLTMMLPRYSSELERSLALRDELSLLAYDVSAANERLGGADIATATTVVRQLGDRLGTFVSHPAGRQLWARDKRELVSLRLFLRAWTPELGLRVLSQQVEGFTRFLELVVEGVSRRPEVEGYDRENAALADLLTP